MAVSIDFIIVVVDASFFYFLEFHGKKISFPCLRAEFNADL